MNQVEQQKAAKDFSAFWKDKGDEKQESQRFWIGLLGDVFGVTSPAKYIEFEKRVQLTHTSYIDAYIADTKVLIEQKGIKIDLHKAYEQSDGTVLTPFEQAKRYADELPNSIRPRWIVVCNFAEFLVYDLENPQSQPEQIFLKDLPKEFYRLQFLVDQKNENIRREEEISLKAGELVGKLYDALVKEYIPPAGTDSLSTMQLRSLNILCVRIVFCLYAEDAGLFETKTAFEDYIKSFALENLRAGIISLFKALDTQLKDRDKYDLKLKPFPYVNGGLFRDEQIEIPNFTQDIVDVIVNYCAPFNWSDISPTIFGAVFEGTLNPETRRKGGMHYTSIQNIHKVIDPLFMDDLNVEFDEICSIKSAKQKAEKLFAFQGKLGGLKFLDPACGSGNFLTETYLCLRRLENKAISIFNKGDKAFGFDEFIKVSINQFYGIEINDFAVTVAKTALWIAESQMVAETEAILSQNIDFLPLTNHANIVEGNALRMDWTTLSETAETGFLFAEKLNVYKIDKNSGDIPVHDSALQNDTSLYGRKFKELNVITKEVEEKELPEAKKEKIVYDYIIGNPPFVGARWMDKRQKEDVLLTFGKDWQGVGDLDYVCSWYKKALSAIKDQKTRCAFVSTNSIVQGNAVAILWKRLFAEGLHIDFAWQTFKWSNETADKGNMAAVHCVIIGFCTEENRKQKIIFQADGQKIVASNINGYLLNAPNVFIESRKNSICDVSQMVFGSMPNDGGNLIIENEEYDDFIKNEPASVKFIRSFLGAEEFINGKKRYCLWLLNASPAELRKMPLVSERVGAVKRLRLSSKRESTKRLADTPWLFGEIRQPETGNYLLVPRVSSENRRYIPIGFVDSDVIASDAVLLVPNANLYEFGIMTSAVHNAWMRAVAGRLKSDYRYSASLVYNNFPWPNPTEEQKEKIERTAQAILDARANHPDSLLADLYDETFMPQDLRKTHEANDKAVMAAYGFKSTVSESEIVAELFKLYESLVK